MSAQTVESILSKAMGDAAFADLLFAQPEQALAGYDLSAEEAASLKGISRAEFLHATPEKRKSLIKACQLRDPESGACMDNNHNETALAVGK